MAAALKRLSTLPVGRRLASRIDDEEVRLVTKQTTRTTQVSTESRLDALHDKIESRLDELHADFKQLETDLQAANQASSRARKDRIEGFKRALQDLLQAANRADREWN
jgi:ferritin-like metal-binding protein YciE